LIYQRELIEAHTGTAQMHRRWVSAAEADFGSRNARGYLLMDTED
jgi:hypothetical protein